jgi:hypothetical protein
LRQFRVPAFDLVRNSDEAEAAGMYVHQTAKAKLVKIGQNWYYSSHA